MFSLWFVEDPGFVKTKAYIIGVPFKEREYKIRSKALEEAQEGKEPQSLNLISVVVNLPCQQCSSLYQVAGPSFVLPAWKW